MDDDELVEKWIGIAEDVTGMRWKRADSFDTLWRTPNLLTIASGNDSINLDRHLYAYEYNYIPGQRSIILNFLIVEDEADMVFAWSERLRHKKKGE